MDSQISEYKNSPVIFKSKLMESLKDINIEFNDPEDYFE